MKASSERHYNIFFNHSNLWFASRFSMIFHKLQSQSYLEFNGCPVSYYPKSVSSRQRKGKPLPIPIACAGRGVSLEICAREPPKDAVLAVLMAPRVGPAGGAASLGFASDAQGLRTETTRRSSPSRYFGHRIMQLSGYRLYRHVFKEVIRCLANPEAPIWTCTGR